MGEYGEHFAVTVYLGIEGIYQLFRITQDPYSIPDHVLEIPQLQASFEDRQLLRPQDLAIIKKLGLKFRGANAYPMFRSIEPGFVPWFLEEQEIRFLQLILEQTLEVALRVKADPSLLKDPRQGYCLIRYIDEEDQQCGWQDRILNLPAPAPFPVQISLGKSVQNVLKSMPKKNYKIEVDLFRIPNPIKEKEARPYFPYLFLIVDAKSGLVLSPEIFTPEKSLIDMWSKIPLHFIATGRSANTSNDTLTIAKTSVAAIGGCLSL
jgi:hypothetical protein